MRRGKRLDNWSRTVTQAVHKPTLSMLLGTKVGSGDLTRSSAGLGPHSMTRDPRYTPITGTIGPGISGPSQFFAFSLLRFSYCIASKRLSHDRLAIERGLGVVPSPMHAECDRCSQDYRTCSTHRGMVLAGSKSRHQSDCNENSDFFHVTPSEVRDHLNRGPFFCLGSLSQAQPLVPAIHVPRIAQAGGFHA